MNAYASLAGLSEALDVLTAAEELVETRLLEFENAPVKDEVHQQLYVAAVNRARDVANALTAVIAVMQLDSPALKVRKSQLHSVSKQALELQ